MSGPDAKDAPYVILVSLDGFRWDYVDRFQPPNLVKFIANGTRAESLVPVFPSKTFPNHYSIATGMYPDKHEILGNLFYSYAKDDTYSIGDPRTVEDGAWYGGTPIWVQAAKAGLVTASYFFVGSEADVQGIRPTYYKRFDGRVPNKDRVAQVLEWLALPLEERPRMITMYFSDMDNIGHRVGPDSDTDLQQTLASLDGVLGILFEGVAQSGLPVNIILVSDHGMQEVALEHYMPIEQLEDDGWFTMVNNGSIVNIHPRDVNDVDAIYEDLKAKENHFSVYRTEEVPYFEQVPNNPNWGSLQLVPDAGYYFSDVRRIAQRENSGRTIFGQHGYDPTLREMHGIFYANGPAIKSGLAIPSIKNIHVYPLICEILNLDIPPDIDGDLREIEEVLVGR